MTRRFLFLAVLVAAAVVALDYQLGQRGPLHERPPEWSAYDILRTSLLAAASFLVVVAARRLTSPWPLQGRWWRGRGPAAVVGAGVSLAAVAGVLFGPDRLTTLAEEDGVIEWASAVLAFCAAGLFGYAACLGCSISPRRSDRVARFLLIGLSGFSFVVAMEEISWFQRVLNYGSPAIVGDRNQSEFNLHNEATDFSENIYYGSVFLVTVLWPSLLGGRRLPQSIRLLETVTPSRFVMYGSITAGAVVFEMWEIVPIQMIFFLSVGLLLTEPAVDDDRTFSPLAVAMAMVMVVVAAVFIGAGDNMTRSWDDTEVRELILPFGLLLYGADVAQRNSARRSSRYRPSARWDRGRRSRSMTQVRTRS